MDRQFPPHRVWIDNGRVYFFKKSPRPAGHTPDGGVVVGSDNARRRLVVFEDPQCPNCRQFEDVSGDLLRREVAAGAVAVEYRIRCFLGPESVRAANAWRSPPRLAASTSCAGKCSPPNHHRAAPAIPLMT
jgi:hypothetical protein